MNENAQIAKSIKNMTQRGMLFVAGNILFRKLILLKWGLGFTDAIYINIF